MNDKIEKRAEQLTKIFSDIKQLDNNELSHLYELVSLHNEALFIVGDLSSEALNVRDTAYLDRKRIFAECILNETGTVAVKEAKAELTITKLREQEKDANAMHNKYKHMYESLHHRLIDLRQKRNKLEDELKTINDKG
ncbi:hypothetical protein [Paraliobacillus ryukyuensis]|uniref:hypothetical protein n=1 Tax=Paraliobacillus ryukyuensis TaxID=200904 RepID=UPI0009A59DB8|nr:hypothetical protein [Paraliobacillus ryukyuensis]